LLRRISRIRLACAAASVAALAGLAGPGTAQAGDLISGAGVMNGTLSFNPAVIPLVAYSPSSFPPVHIGVGACGPSGWSYSDLVPGLSTGGAVLDESALVWYQGFVSIGGLSGGDANECPGDVLGGSFSLASVTGSFPTHQSVNCSGISGSYDRIGSIVLALGTNGGTCQVQSYAPGPVTFKVLGNLAPNNIGGGVTAPVTGAYFDAVWEASFPE
jgi:hypothetical protein